MKVNYNQNPIKNIDVDNASISCFDTNIEGKNIDDEVVNSFGEEWLKFSSFSDEEIKTTGDQYFDIINEKVVNKSSYCIDFGCGTGRWSKYLSDKVDFIEAIDPSNAVLAAKKLLKDKTNIRLTKASIDNIPFDDETFDFGMSIGVLHHIPDTNKALRNCIEKIKLGGYMYVYLYYALDNRGVFYRFIFNLVNFIRLIVSSFPTGFKKFICDLIAFFVYIPIIYIGLFIKFVGLKHVGEKIPLSYYHDKSIFIIRNDALDRFGTKLEQRFSKQQVLELMKNNGLSDIVISEGMPYWHAVGKRVK